MIENKRFTFADGFKIVAIRDNGEIMNSKQVCEKLNELYEENKELKDKWFEAEETLIIETADISDYAFDGVEKDIEELRKEVYGDDV